MTTTNSVINQLQQDIINNSQKDFPLSTRPYQVISEQLKQVGIITSEAEVFNAINTLATDDVLSRVGPVFDHKKAGASTLAALAVPPEELDKVAGIVNQFEQVNHNYGRDPYYKKQQYNLWFVVTASDMVALNSTLANIELLTGLTVLILPMEASYHIDLAFSINITGIESPIAKKAKDYLTQVELEQTPLNDLEKRSLRNIIEQGLPEVLSPYKEVAQQLSLTEQQVQTQIALWQQEGLIRRFGLVIKHRKLGYNANAMVVWNIPDAQMDMVAQQLAKCAPVSLCYQRPRRLPDWPYNLFCMIHGTDRALVLSQIKQITAQLKLETIEKDILFSFKAYKQHGARYAKVNDINHVSKDLSQPSSQFSNQASSKAKLGQHHG